MQANSRIDLTPQAATDIQEIAEYLRMKAGLAVALRFTTKAEDAFSVLADAPKIGASLCILAERDAEIRRWHIDGFDDYLILYRLFGRSVQIVRVLHGARDIEAMFQVGP